MKQGGTPTAIVEPSAFFAHVFRGALPQREKRSRKSDNEKDGCTYRIIRSDIPMWIRHIVGGERRRRRTVRGRTGSCPWRRETDRTQKLCDAGAHAANALSGRDSEEDQRGTGDEQSGDERARPHGPGRSVDASVARARVMPTAPTAAMPSPPAASNPDDGSGSGTRPTVPWRRTPAPNAAYRPKERRRRSIGSGPRVGPASG